MTVKQTKGTRIKAKVSKKTKRGDTKLPDVRKATTKGKTWDLNMNRSWVKLFEDNAKASKNRRLTETQLHEFMKKEFPERTAIQEADVLLIRQKRSYYNGGGWNSGNTPATPSYRYDKEGNALPAYHRGDNLKNSPAQKRGSNNRPSKKRAKRIKARAGSVSV